MFCFPQTSCHLHNEKYFVLKSNLWGKSCLVLGWIKRELTVYCAWRHCQEQDGHFSSGLCVYEEKSWIFVPWHLYPTVLFNRTKMQKISAIAENLSLSKMFIQVCRRLQPLLEVSLGMWVLVPAQSWGGHGSEAGHRHSCLTVSHTESNVPSIFQPDKWRRRDPNGEWPGRKSSVSSNDKTLTETLGEQLWSDDICASVQICLSPTAPQLENCHVSFVGKPELQMC